jgi:hypothetical protein
MRYKTALGAAARRYHVFCSGQIGVFEALYSNPRPAAPPFVCEPEDIWIQARSLII